MGSLPVQLVGLALFIVGGVWLWNAWFLLAAGASLVTLPEIPRLTLAAVRAFRARRAEPKTRGGRR